MPFNKAAAARIARRPARREYSGANPRGRVQSLAQPPHLGSTCPRQNDADRVKHDQLRMPLHFLRHLLKRCLSDETGESFDLLRHLHFSLGNCEASFRARSPARMSASVLAVGLRAAKRQATRF